MKQGFFITIEGPDGAGKSTQIGLIKDFLESRGLKVKVTREPGGTVIGEKIRQLVLDKTHMEISSVTEALLYAASRSQHVAELIVPALNKGEIVLCDRFVDSSIAYQGRGRDLGIEEIEKINTFATQGLQPDLTLFLSINPEESLKRIDISEQGDRLEREKIEFHRRVFEGYEELSRKYPERIKVIKADGTIEEVQHLIEKQLKILLKEEV